MKIACRYHRFFQFLCLFLLLPAAAVAQPPAAAEFSAQIGGQALAGIEERLQQEETMSAPELVGLEEIVTGILSRSREKVEKISEQVEQVEASLQAVGATLAGESSEMSQERQELTGKKAAGEKQLAEYRLLAVRAEQLRAQIQDHHRQLVAQQLLHRGPTGPAMLKEGLPAAVRAWQETNRFLLQRSGLEQLGGERLLLLSFLLLMSGGLGMMLRRPLHGYAAAMEGEKLLPGLRQALLFTTARYLPAMLSLLLLTGFMAVVLPAGEPRPYLLWVFPVMLGYLLAILPVQALLRPPAPAPVLHRCPPAVTGCLLRRLQAVAAFGLAGFLFMSDYWPAAAGESRQLFLILFVTMLCLALLWLVWPLRQLPRLAAASRRWRLGLILVLATVTVLAWLGFTNLAIYLLYGLIGTGLVVATFWGGNFLLTWLFYGLEYGPEALQPARRGERSEDRKIHKSFSWLLLISRFLLLVVLGLALLRFWGASQTLLNSVQTFLTEGFTLGELAIVPARLGSGFGVFLVLWTISSWVKGKLEKEWLQEARLAPGAQETLVTLLGYGGFVFAILAGLSVSGVDFTGLAVIAGALSVGIGFGMQNVVNNFVSGLILLFERPIKKGDWIVVGETQGYVQKISVRSTLIQTFDRADVIVPNSELIASQVTNLMLNDTWGRVRVPVGVAYGSDTELVRRVLLQVMDDHALIIKDPEVPPGPQVLFIGFGPSSLDFELRCFIRDINRILVVKSDLNFAIDAAFRANGIEIPYPKQDLYVREMPASWRSPAEAVTSLPPEADQASVPEEAFIRKIRSKRANSQQGGS